MNDTRDVGRSATPARELESFRDEFPILERKAYLNSNSLGALSLGSIRECRRFEELWNELGASAWYELWMGKLDEVRAAFGRTIGASREQIALMPSVSATLAAVAGAIAGGREGAGAGAIRGDDAGGAIARRRRSRVVLTELDFPTVGHHFLSREPLGIEVEIVRSPDGVEVPIDALADAIDERTALVVTSHVFFSTGAVQDAAAIATLAHEAGARVLLDAYQSNGQLPIDVRDLGVDFLVSGSLKWLCGGPGLAYLYVRPDVELAPTTLSWFGVENQFAFDVRDATPRRDARRFEMGTPAMGAVYTAAGGLAVIEEARIDRICDRNRALADDLRARLVDAGLTLHESPSEERRSALVLAHHPDPRVAVARLAENDVIIDSRGPFIRLSPHFYNTIEDNERAVEALTRYRG